MATHTAYLTASSIPDRNMLLASLDEKPTANKVRLYFVIFPFDNVIIALQRKLESDHKMNVQVYENDETDMQPSMESNNKVLMMAYYAESALLVNPDIRCTYYY